MSLSSDIEAVLAVDPSAAALEYQGEWVSWGDLRGHAARISACLQSLGLEEGARVGVLLRNHREIVPALLALFTSGRCLASLNANAPGHKLAEDLADAQVPVLVGLAADLDRPGIAEAAATIGAAMIRLGAGSVEI